MSCSTEWNVIGENCIPIICYYSKQALKLRGVQVVNDGILRKFVFCTLTWPECSSIENIHGTFPPIFAVWSSESIMFAWELHPAWAWWKIYHFDFLGIKQISNNFSAKILLFHSCSEAYKQDESKTLPEKHLLKKMEFWQTKIV